MSRWFILPINAQPWTTGRISAGKKDGKITGRLSPDMQLQIFQNAVREEMENVDPLPDGKYSLTFYIWRKIEEYTKGNRRVVKHVVDATNIQKGLEDALQGNLIGNDREVAEIRTVIVEQDRNTVPYIVIKADSWNAFDPDEIPDSIWSDMDERSIEISFEELAEKSHDYHTDEDVF